MDNIECSIVGSERSWFLEGGKDRVRERVCTIGQNIFTFAEKFLWRLEEIAVTNTSGVMDRGGISGEYVANISI